VYDQEEYELPKHANDDAYGEKSRMRKRIVIKSVTTSRREFMRRLRQIVDMFWEHQYVAHSQHDAFDACIDNLPATQMIILEDFAMSYSHIHQEETQGEHWEHWSTTLFNTVVYAHRDNPTGGGKSVWATAEPFVSPDRKHSNEFVKHCNNILIQRWKEKIPGLEAVHIWSDGCKGQFKQKAQWYWLTEAAKEHGITITHNFFQSCHGKGPADGEGAVYKRGMREAELFGVYMQDSKAAFNWLVKERSKVGHRKHKSKHSILERHFHYVEVGEVDHRGGAVLKGGDGSASKYRFVSSPETGFVQMGLLSCFCASCFRSDFANCTTPKHTALKCVRCFQEAGRGIGSRRSRTEAFNNKRAKELLDQLKPDDDVFLYLSPLDRQELGCGDGYLPARVVTFEGGWKEKVGGKDFIKVVQYKPLGNRQWEWNEAELCTKLLESCYTVDHSKYDAASGDVILDSGEKHRACNKQHCTKKPATALRPPLEFQLDDVRSSTRGTSASPRRKVLASPGLHQKVVQVLKEDGEEHEEAYFS